MVNNVWDQDGYDYVDTFSNGDGDTFGDARFHNIRSLERPRTVWFSARKDF